MIKEGDDVRKEDYEDPLEADATFAFQLGDALFAEWIGAVHAQRDRPILVGLCGSQGSGKSTTAARLNGRLAAAGLATVICSLDDFYLTHVERQHLANAVHPLLATRGVPGTHDVPLMRRTIDKLLAATASDITAVPIFDKALDDRLEPKDWQRHHGTVDVVILEGWCVGAQPQAAAALAAPVNVLEEDEDRGGKWRHYVNVQLAGDYAELFDRIDTRLLLRAPSFECVFQWRMEQENKLPRSGGRARQPMAAAEMQRFIAHYERITRWLLQSEPAHLIADIDKDRRPYAWRGSDPFLATAFGNRRGTAPVADPLA